MKTASTGLKQAPNALFIYIDRHDGLHNVGTLTLEDSPFAASFRYSASWLNSPHAFALDPINLPLRQGEFATQNKYLVLGALFDAAPDLWGRRLIAAHHGLDDVPDNEASILLLGSGNGVGALLYSTEPDLMREQLPLLTSLPLLEHDLARTHQAAFDIIQGKYASRHEVEFEDGHLLAGSSGIGGARAKAILRDKHDQLWIAKFAEPDADLDRQRMEYANLRMAQEIGIEIPKLRLAETHLGSVLLVKRFDRTPNHSRLHYVSAISLISHAYQDKYQPTALDKAKFSYAQIADIIGRVCEDPAKDRQRLFAQMLLNFMVKNTDDHLKNFGFIETESSASGGATTKRLRLSPAFDIVTQVSPIHHLFTSYDGIKGDVSHAISSARAFGLTQRGAEDIANRVQGVVERRNTFYREAEMTEKDIATVNRHIGNRCVLLDAPMAKLDRTQDSDEPSPM